MDNDRLLQLREPHVGPLMDLIRGIRKRGLEVPNVDPNASEAAAILQA